ncbi:MAG TPA: hypothetical protein VJN67_20380 [Stellaceae bacterium]|nr:hypothetical protein [Stellaceae bacterium]
MRARLVMVDEELMAFASAPLTASAAGRAQGGMDETVALPPADNLRLAFEDADLVAQHQQLGLISGAVAKRCQGDVDEEIDRDTRAEPLVEILDLETRRRCGGGHFLRRLQSSLMVAMMAVATTMITIRGAHPASVVGRPTRKTVLSMAVI